jgi:GntR family transcriptional regulator
VNSSTETSTVLDRSSESPLWAQFRDALRLQILQGVLPIGAKLPSEAELGEQFGISRIVVREALADLVRNNLIYKIKGRGAFVSARERDEDFVSTVLGFSDEMERKGRSVRTQILTQELRAPTEQEAASLGLTDDTQVVALKRLRSVDGELRLLVETVVPADLAPGLHRTRLDDRSLYDVLRRQYGLRLVRAERWIDAVLPDAATCELLNLPTPEPLLRIESIAYGANGRPPMAADCFARRVGSTSALDVSVEKGSRAHGQPCCTRGARRVACATKRSTASTSHVTRIDEFVEHESLDEKDLDRLTHD